MDFLEFFIAWLLFRKALQAVNVQVFPFTSIVRLLIPNFLSIIFGLHFSGDVLQETIEENVQEAHFPGLSEKDRSRNVYNPFQM